jgi:diguanylate cyclase
VTSLGVQAPKRPVASFTWPRAILLAAAAAALYGILPLLAPSQFVGDVDALLLGVVLGLVVGIASRVEQRLVASLSIGSFVGILFAFAIRGTFGTPVVMVAVIVAIEVWLAPALLRVSGGWDLADLRDVVSYGLVAVGVAAVAGLAGALALLGYPVADEFLHLWRSWAVDDVFGLICIAPAVITLRRPSTWSWGRAVEYGVAVAYTLLSTYLIFFFTDPEAPGLLGWPYLVGIGTIWIAVRLGLQAVAPVVAVQFWLAVLGTVAGGSTFARAASEPLDRLIAVEIFAILMASTAFALAVMRDSRLATLAQVEGTSRLLREVVDGTDALVFAKAHGGSNGGAGRYVLVNRGWSDATGLAAEETVGRTDGDLFPAELAAAFELADDQVLRENEPLQVQEVNADAAGRMRTYLSFKFPLRGPDGRPWGIGGIATDITDVLEARERERRQAELLHAVFELSPTPAVRLTIDRHSGMRVGSANAAMCRLMGAPVGAWDECDLLEHVHPDDATTATDLIAVAAGAAGGAAAAQLRQREVRMRTRDGRTVWLLMSAAAVGNPGEDQTEVVAQFEDFTARREAEEALTDQALRDAVTGLPNRRALRERIEAALTRLRRHPGSVTVLFCDLDNFKDVNDSLGHHVGDLLLVEVAHRLRAAVRPEDTIARLGGDEFVALGEGVADPSDAVLVALRLQDRLCAPWPYGEMVFRPAMSVGIATTTDPDMSVDELLRRADLAMYRAKEHGRNRVEVYDTSVDEEVQHSVAIQHDLRRAIDSGTLQLLYQPIVTLADGRVTGAEALVRMRGRDGVLLSPAAFVPQAEVSGLVVPMGAWVIQQALADLVRLHESRHDYSMSINVSPVQLREEGFADYLLGQLRFAGVEPSWLAVEVTETALIHDPVRSARELAALSEAGIRISLDDFGTGYSSLSWLTQFPVDLVKVDKSFTDELGIDERKTAIISAVISVSHELGFSVVAEGVESEEQRVRLLELGCDLGQGYLFGRPSPIQEAPWQ